jgi:hypothetical protein
MNEHLGGAHIDSPDGNMWMPDVWRYMITNHGVKSMVDVGCGGGWTAKWFLDNGVDAVGIEGWDKAISKNQLPKDKLIVHDYTKGPITVPKCDLAWAGEFVEHVEAMFIPNFAATFLCAKKLLMTHAIPGQCGHHHVNEQHMDYWVSKMSEFGFALDPVETLKIRDIHPVSGGWGIQTMLYFERTL